MPAVVRLFIPLLILIYFTGLYSCTGKAASRQEGLLVIATLFPQYDFARQIAGDKASVRQILPPGVEPHSFEPKPRDVTDILKADIFLYTGKAMEPWARIILDKVRSKRFLAVDLSRNIPLVSESSSPQHLDHDGHDDAHDHGKGTDPHFWTDPRMAMIMAGEILAAFTNADPANAPYYISNAAVLNDDLSNIDAEYKAILSDTRLKTIIYSGHFAFGYLARRYNLKHITPYTGFSPDAEPNPRKIAELLETMKRLKAKAIFYEELLEPKTAMVIADKTGAVMLMLNAGHNVSREDLEHGITYVRIMRNNLINLKKGLE